MGPVILARALGERTPYAVKVHGSALEYTVRPNRERFLPYALEGVRGAAGRARGLAPHRREPLGGARRARAARAHPARAAGRGRAHLPAARARRGGGRRSGGWPGASSRARRPSGAERRTPRPRWRRSIPSRDRIVSYVGKLIVSKGVDLLLAAWPLVVARVPDARLVIVGFGTYRETLGRYVDALRARGPGRPAGHRGARARARGRARRAGWRTSVVPGPGGRRSGSAPPRRPPSACTSPAGSSTRTSPTCCRPARRR